MTDLISIAIALFLIANPVGNTPAILAVVRSFSFEDQKRIIFRESLFALGLALFFVFFGEVFFRVLEIDNWAIGYSGGILLLVVALNMIFAKAENPEIEAAKEEPFFVPIATPIISGPGLLTMIMIFSTQEQNNLKMSLAILLAWIGVMGVMLSGPYLRKILGRRGMIALEQLMGMVLTFMSIDLMVNATAQFMRQQ